ncbi:MAG: M91 family zinc metallopeptidase [Pseudomonadota bacterium]
MAENHFGVWVDGEDRPTHLPFVVSMLHVLQTTATGRAVFAEIRRAHFPVTVIPQDGAPGTGPANFTRQGFRHATQAGKVAHDGRGAVIGGFGAGLGTAVRIDYSPELHVHGAPLDGPDCVLVHELAHGTRYARGKLNAQPMYEFGFETREEVHAGIVTNMFRSERNMERFRIQRVPQVRWGGLEDANLTFGMAKYLIRAFAAQQEEFFAELAAVDTPFNPVRPALA